MDLSCLTAISPIDGRYWKQTNCLSSYFSEFGLIRYRVFVEIEYFVELCERPLPQLGNIEKSVYDALRRLHKDFKIVDAQRIKEIEKSTNHDIKAIEYWLKEEISKMPDQELNRHKEFIHFALTSQDINNTAIPLALKEAMEFVYLPALRELKSSLQKMSLDWIDIPMLARTHGQPATPTRVGKEMMVFVDRLEEELTPLSEMKYTAKFGGATGQFNAHYVAYPMIDWISFADKFVERLNLKREQWTTQISHYDSIARLCDALKRINTILINLCRDMWTYISIGYFKQKINFNEIGSSTMPHKVNPIDFENAEGNFGIANALFGHLSAKLPISRLQRDLTDSTVLRNLGVPIGHSLLAISSLKRGLSKLILNHEAINSDLEENWAVVTEALQTILRRESYPEPYEALKRLSRTGEKLTQKTVNSFIDSLNIKDGVKEELKMVSPFNYTGRIPQEKL